jgi:hypothetical protein
LPFRRGGPPTPVSGGPGARVSLRDDMALGIRVFVALLFYGVFQGRRLWSAETVDTAAYDDWISDYSKSLSS